LARIIHEKSRLLSISSLTSFATNSLDFTPLDRQLEKPVSSREGELAWIQTGSVRHMIDSLSSML
jgi:hypothetical protein